MLFVVYLKEKIGEELHRIFTYSMKIFYFIPDIPRRDKMIEKLLEELKQYMLENNLTQKKLAELLQVNQPQISRLFSGTRQPSAKMINKIETLLKGE